MVVFTDIVCYVLHAEISIKGVYKTSDYKILIIKLFKYIEFFVFGANVPQCARGSVFTRFLDHTQRRTTVSRTPLGE